MLKNIMTQFRNSKSTFLLLLWLVLELLYVSMRVVYWLILMIPYLVFSLVIWRLEDTSLKELESESMLEEYEASMLGSEVERSNTLVLYLFLKSLRQRLSVALKMEFEEDQQQSTSQSGTKK